MAFLSPSRCLGKGRAEDHDLVADSGVGVSCARLPSPVDSKLRISHITLRREEVRYP